MGTFRKGDKVSVQGTVAYDHDGTLGHLFIDLPDSAQVLAKPEYVTLVAQAIEPGDLVEVKLSTRMAVGTVIAVYAERGMAWLDLGDEGTAQQPLASLKRVERTLEIADAA